MATFQVKASSWVIYFLTFFIVLTVGTMIGTQLLHKVNDILYFIVLITLGIIIVRYAGIARTEWTFSNQEIKVKWLSQFIFHNRKDLIIKWEEIAKYQIRAERSFDLFKLVLSNGKTIRLWHDNLIRRDDFQQLLSYFLEKVEAHNKMELEKTN